ncbi:MAG: nitroreductase family protein [Actinomycetota bacterium]|nr:nitroreductase family protein [Actinomycetota bacterium]
MELDLNSIDHVLTTTRTVRKRLDLERPVDREVLNECLRIGIQAPTGSNLQRWRWVVVTDPEKRKLVAEIYGRAIDPYVDIMAEAFENSPEAKPLISSTRYLSQNLARVPVQVIPCQLGTYEEQRVFLESARYPYGVSDNMAASGFYGSIWPAVWSFMVALRARGLGSALTTMHLAFEREIAEVLGIPETVSQVGLIAVAYFKGEDFKPARRRPVEEITYWDSWKKVEPAAAS